MVTRKVISNELSNVIAELSDLKANEAVGFRKLTVSSGSGASKTVRDDGNGVEGDKAENVCLYWQSNNQLSFIGDGKGGITEY
jgi:hypothetical protein